MKTILIVEDDIELREELATFLKNSGYQVTLVTEFDTLSQTFSNLTSNVDLILLDINIPGMNGESLLKEFRKTSNIPVIMVTSKNNEMDELLCMSYGADDYITKPYNPQILLLRIEAVLKRMNQTSTVLSYRDITFHLSKGIIQKGNIEVPLSKNELKIFYYLLMHQGTIVSREEIMRYLWDTEEFIDDNTLTVNMNRIRNKLREIGLTNAIETRRGQGYILL